MKPCLIFLMCFLLLSFGCSKYKNDKCKDGIKVTLIRARLDGCGWLLRLANGEYLEPINIMDFNITLIQGRSVRVSYLERMDILSICMVGKTVEIKCIE
ncbi:MAG: hypothetical protein ABIO55_08270 [Ginsengibacter sp.]